MGNISVGAGLMGSAQYLSLDAGAATGFNDFLGLFNSGGGLGIQYGGSNLGIGSFMLLLFAQSEDINPVFMGAMSGVTNNIDNLTNSGLNYLKASKVGDSIAKANALSGLVGSGAGMGVGVIGGALQKSDSTLLSSIGTGLTSLATGLANGVMSLTKAAKAARAAGTAAHAAKTAKVGADLLKTEGAIKTAKDLANSAKAASDAAKTAKIGALNLLGSAGIGVVGSALNSAIGADYGTWGNLAGSVMDTAAGVIASSNPLTAGVYWGTKLINSGLNKAIGASNYDVGDLLLNNVPVFGLLNNALGRLLADYKYDYDMWSRMGSGYADTQKDAEWGRKHAGQRAGGLLHNANALADRMDNLVLQDTKIHNIDSNNLIAQMGASMNQLIGWGTDMANRGGLLLNASLGRNGMKFDTSFAKRAIALLKSKKEAPTPVETTEVEAFKNGGTFNVIPDGALHKNKHHLSDIDEKFEEVTEKGVPVITESEGGEITQHAEVEINEIIFRLEVTKELEKLLEVNRHHTNSQKEKDDAAIEAGKLLVEEILRNTHDNTGLLKEVLE